MRTLVKLLFLAVSYFSSLTMVYVEVHADSLKVGVIVPLSGSLAEYGTAVKNALKLAEEEIGKNDEAPPRFIFEDSQYDPKTALSAFHKLVYSDKVNVVIDWGSATSMAIAPLAEARKIPFIALTVLPDISAGKNFVLRSFPGSNSFAHAMLRVMRELEVKELHIVKVEDAYYNQMFDSLKEAKATGEKLTVVYSAPKGEIFDFKTVIAKLRTNTPKMIGVLLFPGQLSAFYREMARQNLCVYTVGADSYESKKELSDAGGAMSGAFFVSLGTSSAFQSLYSTRFGNDIQVTFAGNAYDLGMMLHKTSNSLLPEEFTLGHLISVAPYDGVNGSYQVIDTSEKGRVLESPVYIKQIVGEDFVTIGPAGGDKLSEFLSLECLR